MTRIEAASRALCLIDRIDPDERVAIGHRAMLSASGAQLFECGRPVETAEYGPQWRNRSGEAVRVLAIIEAVKGIKHCA